MTQAINGRGRFFAIAMAIFLTAMLCASLWQRFTKPGLVIHRFAQQRAESAPAGDMDIVGSLMRTVAKNPQNLQATLKLVETLMAMGQWDVAENFARKALALGADNPLETRPLYLLALIHHNRKEHAQAAELLEKVLEKDENPSARYSLGILYIHYLDNPEKGARELRAGIASGKASPALKAAMEDELAKIAVKHPATDAGNGASSPPASTASEALQ